MKIAKSGRIQDFCQPNALLSLQEYMEVCIELVSDALVVHRNSARLYIKLVSIIVSRLFNSNLLVVLLGLCLSPDQSRGG